MQLPIYDVFDVYLVKAIFTQTNWTFFLLWPCKMKCANRMPFECVFCIQQTRHIVVEAMPFFFHSNCNLSKSIEFPLNPIGCVNMYSVFFWFQVSRLVPMHGALFFMYTEWWSREKRMKTIKFVYSSLIVYFSLANFYWQSSLVHGIKGEKIKLRANNNYKIWYLNCEIV